MSAVLTPSISFADDVLITHTYECKRSLDTEYQAVWSMETIRGSNVFNHCGISGEVNICSKDEDVKVETFMGGGIVNLIDSSERYVKFVMDTEIMTVSDPSTSRFDKYQCVRSSTTKEKI